MIGPLPEAAFPSLLADLWRERGWEADVAARDDGTYLVGGERDGGVRGLLLAVPDPDAEVRTAHLRTFAETCEARDVGVAVVATQGSFTGEARRVASDSGIHLLDRSRLEETIREGGFEAVLRRHRGAEDGAGTETGPGEGRDDDGEADAPGGGWRTRVRAALPDRTGEAAAALRARVAADPERLLAAVVVLAVLTSGVVVGVPGVSGGADPEMAVSAVSTATPDANESLTVRWNAAARPTLDAPGGAFAAPPNETFVVVRLDVSHGGGDPLLFGEPNLVFESDGVRYGSQPLTDANVATIDRFEAGDAGTVWAVFSVPADATAGTVLVRNGLAADGPGVRFVHDASLGVAFDAPASEAEAEAEAAGSETGDASEAASASLAPVHLPYANH